MKVKVLRDHDNGFGETFEKKVGSTYEVDEASAQQLVSSKLVEEVKSASKKAD